MACSKTRHSLIDCTRCAFTNHAGGLPPALRFPSFSQISRPRWKSGSHTFINAACWSSERNHDTSCRKSALGLLQVEVSRNESGVVEINNMNINVISLIFGVCTSSAGPTATACASPNNPTSRTSDPPPPRGEDVACT